VSSKQYNLKLRNDLAQVAVASDWLNGLALDLGLSRLRAFEIGVCLEEAFSNVVQFAFPDGGEHDISLSLCVQPGSLKLVVEDGGVSFDPLSLDPPDSHLTIDTFPVGGLGVHLMRSFARGLDYKRVARRNRLTLSFDHP
jgi:anti-sigma regulatory factor (Ser/Thr protein kinase)